MGLRPRVLGLAAAVLCTAAPGARAEDGVHVDTGSPAGKEYVIPVEKARREAAGKTGGDVPVGDTSAPAFGSGITPDRGTAAARARTSGAGAGAGKPVVTPGGTGVTGTPGTATTAAAPPAATPARGRAERQVDRELAAAGGGGGSGGALVLLVGGVLVVGVGAGAGFAARRRSA